MIKLLMIENTTENQDKYIDFPTWQDVENNIRLLNGITRTYMCLYTEEEPNADVFFLIGGGKNGIYVCTYYNGDEFSQINPLNKNDESVIMVPVGQTSGKLKKQCINLEQAIQSTKYYFDKGEIEGFPNWEEL